MFNRLQRKKSLEKGKFQIMLVNTPIISNVIEISNVNDKIQINEEQCSDLKALLREVTSHSEVKAKYFKELHTTAIREKQLTETKEVVDSLLETDRTTEEAMTFLREKLDLLIEENESLVMKLVSFQEELEKMSDEEIAEKVECFIASLNFLDTRSWEEKIDYYRTRFLMQKEQVEDQKNKEKSTPIEEKILDYRKDPLAKSDELSEEHIQKPKIIIALPKMDDELMQLATVYNQLAVELPQNTPFEDLIASIELLKEKFTLQEQISFNVGKELYALKREQGILTMKTYDIIQTLRSRILNISGSLASRVFLKQGLNDLVTSSSDQALQNGEKRTILQKEIKRLLRILG